MRTLGWLSIFFGIYILRRVFMGGLFDAEGNFTFMESARSDLESVMSGKVPEDTASDGVLPVTQDTSVDLTERRNPASDPSEGKTVASNPSWDKMNPRSVKQAIAWARAKKTFPPGYCERMVTLAYGHNGGHASARAHWNAFPSLHRTGDPPAGALVFWRGNSKYGHVALSTGNGYAISTDFDGVRYAKWKVREGKLSNLDKWSPRLGWIPPKF